MKPSKTILLLLVCTLTLLAGLALLASPDVNPSVRSFEFTYLTKIPAVPAGGGPSRIWIPLPQSDPYQTIRSLRIESPLSYVEHTDPEYGNRYLYIQASPQTASAAAEVRVTFEVTRREHRVSLDPHPTNPAATSISPDLRRFLQPDALVPLNGVIAELSANQTHALQDPLAKARAIYDYVIATMRYDKSGTGWGNGDAIWACTAKRGNCTDFHSLFIGMMRAAGIPARFEIGFPLPPDRHAGAVPGYHCWAEFYVQPYGWIPVDVSEGWKHPERKDYFFGAHDSNRLQFSVGRDIRLDPPQHGSPLNYFIYPYREVDGAPLALPAEFSFRDRP